MIELIPDPFFVVRITMCFCMLYVFKEMSLSSNIYQLIFFEVPFYSYMVVGYTLVFSW